MKEYCGETFSKIERAGGELSGFLFEDCLFTGCRFESCKVVAPQFQGVQMLSCDFDHCDLSGVDWSALMDQRKLEMGFLPFDSLRDCSLRHCVFFGLDLKGFDFSKADLSGAVFDGCNLKGASFAQCRLQGTSFAQNDLSEGDFRGATEYFFSLEGNRVKGAKFSLPEAVNLLAALGIRIEEP